MAIASAAFLAPDIASGTATNTPGARVPATPAINPKIPNTPTIPSMASLIAERATRALAICPEDIPPSLINSSPTTLIAAIVPTRSRSTSAAPANIIGFHAAAPPAANPITPSTATIPVIARAIAFNASLAVAKPVASNPLSCMNWSPTILSDNTTLPNRARVSIVPAILPYLPIRSEIPARTVDITVIVPPTANKAV